MGGLPRGEGRLKLPGGLKGDNEHPHLRLPSRGRGGDLLPT